MIMTFLILGEPMVQITEFTETTMEECKVMETAFKESVEDIKVGIFDQPAYLIGVDCEALGRGA